MAALAKAELAHKDEEMKAKDSLIATIELVDISNDKPVEQTNKDSNPEILNYSKIKKCKNVISLQQPWICWVYT